jgi:hypothetical protein
MQIIKGIFLGLLAILIFYFTAMTWGTVLIRHILPFTCDINDNVSIFTTCVAPGGVVNIAILSPHIMQFSTYGLKNSVFDSEAIKIRILYVFIVGSLVGIGLGITTQILIPKLIIFDVGSWGYFLVAWIIGFPTLLILFLGPWFFKGLLDKNCQEKEEEKLIIKTNNLEINCDNEVKLGYLQVNYDVQIPIENLEPVYLESHKS